VWVCVEILAKAALVTREKLAVLGVFAYLDDLVEEYQDLHL
jgi:hypothetical protein